MSTFNDYKWWEKDMDKVYETLMPYVNLLETNQSVRRQQVIQFARLYQNQAPGVFTTELASAVSSNSMLSQWTSRNVIKSSVDTATSKIGKNRPRPVFLTEDGDFKKATKAKKLQQFLDGQFAAMKIYDKGADVFRDGSIFGIGHLKFYVDENAGTVDCERVLPDEIIVDEADSLYGCPTQIHQRRYVSKSALMKKYPEKAREIERCKPAFVDGQRKGLNTDLIRLVESYKLPSGPDAKDGRKVLCVETATLDDVEWTKSYFPYVAWRWCKRVSGYWGLGIAEELYGTQLEINNILRNIQVAQRLVAVPRVFVQNGSLVSAKIDNNIGAVVKYTGSQPTFSTAQAMTGEIYSHLQWLVQSAFEQIGISQMSANGTVPAGLEAAVAMREYADQTSERFLVVGQTWESFYEECGNLVLDLTKDLMEMGKNPKVKVSAGDFMKTIKWSEVNMDADRYTLRMWMANLLPTTPAGKLAKVQELVQSGWIPKEEGLALLDFPDLKAYTNQVLASKNLTDKMIDAALEDGRFIAPEPQMNLAQALSTAQQRYLEAKVTGAPSRNLGVLDRWMEAVKGLMPATPQAVNPMQPVEPGADGGAIAQPEANPTSDLMPFQQG